MQPYATYTISTTNYSFALVQHIHVAPVVKKMLSFGVNIFSTLARAQSQFVAVVVHLHAQMHLATGNPASLKIVLLKGL